MGIVTVQNEVTNLSGQVEQMDSKCASTEKANKNLKEQVQELQVC